jgi:uncharacterized protein YjbI with pentapeptide repeats
MVDNHQDKTEGKQTATEETLSPLSSKDQSKLESQAQSQASEALTKPSTRRAKYRLLVVAMIDALVGVIVLIYSFRLDWPWKLIPLTLFGILLLIFLILVGYAAQWTGFSGYDKETKEYEYDPNEKLKKITKEHQPGKTFWDWMQLLLIPLVLAVGGFLFTAYQHNADQQRALDQQQAAILQTYIDNIQDLLLNHDLQGLGVKSQSDSVRHNEVVELARARTLTALQGLDPERKGRLLLFLHEAHLIGYQDNTSKVQAIIDLSGANLSGAELGGTLFFHADLSGAELGGTILLHADLSYANLENADLSYARMDNADLIGAGLGNAILTSAFLNSATLARAGLGNAILKDTQLENANLTDAVLDGANLDGTDLKGAILIGDGDLTQQQLNNVSDCRGAILPKGLTCPNN